MWMMTISLLRGYWGKRGSSAGKRSGEDDDEFTRRFAHRAAISSVRRSARAVRGQQGGLVSNGVDAEPVAGEPLGIPSDLGPGVGGRSRSCDRPTGLWPLRPSAGAG